jgi:hypothetical protein
VLATLNRKSRLRRRIPLQRVASPERNPRNNLLKPNLPHRDRPRPVLDSQVASVDVAVDAGGAAVDGSRQLPKPLPQPRSRDPYQRHQPNLRKRRTLQKVILPALQKLSAKPQVRQRFRLR